MHFQMVKNFIAHIRTEAGEQPEENNHGKRANAFQNFYHVIILSERFYHR